MTRAASTIGGGRRRLAIVGTGISGLLAAERLATAHDVTVFEAEDRIGGHTHTVDVPTANGQIAVDTGFIVCNDRTYPEFFALLARLGVPLRPTTMSFSVHGQGGGFEYCGTGLRGLFARRRNLVSPTFWSMLRDILRFHRIAESFEATDLTLAEVLRESRLGAAFARWYLVPMMAAIWSARPVALSEMPARFFVRFFRHHGMLQVRDRPQWFTVVGGSRQYLGPLSSSFADRIRLRSPVVGIRRGEDGVHVRTLGQEPERFDGVVLATHTDTAVRMLEDPSDAERELLAAIPFQSNDVVLHTDTRLMPRRRDAWAAWNYRLAAESSAGGDDGTATVTYDMNALMGLSTTERYLVSLNSTAAIAPEKIVRRFEYDHPVFDVASVAAQERVGEVNGSRRVWFCGAWCGFGFHEDGVRAALRVAEDFGIGNGAMATTTPEVVVA
ncbi:MAG: FAD-dependent oxidoreductase [bacterium]|nr:FAD-dependent oxidoreductase [bacterium]